MLREITSSSFQKQLKRKSNDDLYEDFISLSSFPPEKNINIVIDYFSRDLGALANFLNIYQSQKAYNASYVEQFYLNDLKELPSLISLFNKVCVLKGNHDYLIQGTGVSDWGIDCVDEMMILNKIPKVLYTLYLEGQSANDILGNHIFQYVPHEILYDEITDESIQMLFDNDGFVRLGHLGVSTIKQSDLAESLLLNSIHARTSNLFLITFSRIANNQLIVTKMLHWGSQVQ